MNALSQSLRAAGRGAIPVIPDFKRFPRGDPCSPGATPSPGRGSWSGGAPALSVVTEQAHFGGSMALLADICAAVSIPCCARTSSPARTTWTPRRRRGRAILLICACLPRTSWRACIARPWTEGWSPWWRPTPRRLDFAGQLGSWAGGP